MSLPLPLCGACRYCVPIVGPVKDLGECRRFPPPVDGSTAVRSFFPTVHLDWWCGEWQEKPPAFVPARAEMLAGSNVRPIAPAAAPRLVPRSEPGL